ncbi:MAG: hypothetical protein Q8N09_02330 [Thermodesulfovibrionia bacterium]|nr:hypothetical protein [Thermodesulfovibrionia bacterium]
MKILHILNDGSTDLSKKVIDVQSKEHNVKVINLSKKDVSYDAIIDEIFFHDKVISW